MKRYLPILSLLLFVPTLYAGEEVDRLLSEYGKIETVTCQIRRIKEGAAGKMRFLSRVYWTNEDQLHAEGISPLKRRTIADGTHLFQYMEGNPKGFSRPITELSEQMKFSLRFVPGTAMDNLLRLEGLEETVLVSDGEFAKQVGIQADEKYVVLSFDAANRLAGIYFFETAAQKKKLASYTYGNFNEVLPGVWVPFAHEIVVENDQVHFAETVKVDRFIANKPVAKSLFVASSFFDKDIDFVDDFAKIFPSNKEE